MTSSGDRRRSLPTVATRVVLMLVAAAVVSACGLVVVNLLTSPAARAIGSRPRESGEEEMPRDPHVRDSLGELALQLGLVGGIAFAGRKILKIRL